MCAIFQARQLKWFKILYRNRYKSYMSHLSRFVYFRTLIPTLTWYTSKKKSNSYFLPLFFCPSFHVFVFCDCFAINLRSPKIPPPSGFSLSRFSFSSSYSFAVLNFQISNYGRANRFSLPSYTPKISPQFSIPHKFLPPHYFMPHHGSHPALPTLSTEHCSNAQRECFHSICISVQE